MAPPGKGDKGYISCGTRDDTNKEDNDTNDDEDELYYEDDEEDSGEHAPSDHIERDAVGCKLVFSLLTPLVPLPVPLQNQA